MKIQKRVIVITALLFNSSTHTSSTKRNQPPQEETYRKGDKQQQKFDARQAAYAAALAARQPSIKQEDGFIPSRKYINAIKEKPKRGTKFIPTSYIDDPAPAENNNRSYQQDDYYSDGCPLLATIIDPTTKPDCTCGAHAVTVTTAVQEINEVYLSKETAGYIDEFFRLTYDYDYFDNPYVMTIVMEAIKNLPKNALWSTQRQAQLKALWQAVCSDVVTYDPFEQWKSNIMHEPCSDGTCTTCQVENGTYKDPLSVALCECLACVSALPKYDFFCHEYRFMQMIAQQYVEQQKHYHQNASLKENVDRLQQIFLEKDRKAQVEELVKQSKTRPKNHIIWVYDPQKFDPSHPYGYVKSRWLQTQDAVDRAREVHIRETIQFADKVARAKKEEKKAALVHAQNFLSQEELDTYQLTPKQARRTCISKKDCNEALSITPLAGGLIDPIDAEEEYFKKHTNYKK